jgi:peptide deformylase
MLLPIVAYGDTVLRQKCKNINSNFEGLQVLLENMWQTMYKAEGVGLAAPQIGLPIRLFIVDTIPFEEKRKKDLTFKGFRKVFINAEILERTGAPWPFEEGCLSIPGIREEVFRPESITLKYFDEHFVQHTDTFESLNARVIQHEYDHIEGILFIDHLKSLKKKLLQPKLQKISKGIVSVDYKMKFAFK